MRDERTVLENIVNWLLAIDVIRLNAAPMALDPLEIMLAPEDTAFDAELIFEETIDPSPEIAVFIWVRSDEKADPMMVALIDTTTLSEVIAVPSCVANVEICCGSVLVIDWVLFNELTNVEICVETPDRFAADKLVAAVAMA